MNVVELQAYFLGRKNISTGRMKTLLYRYKIKEQKCSECGVTDLYNNKPITLQLHHVDGNSQNNQFTNLQILCPNCHSQTSNFRNKKPITESDILNACKDAKTISDAVRALKRYPSGSLYKKIEKVIQEHNLPIEKYNYRINNNTTRGVRIKDNEYINCLYCSKLFVKKSDKKYCCYKCSNAAACKYDIDVPVAIDLIKTKGWSQAARELGINSKYPDVNLRIIVKRYIKNNDITIDYYSLSKYAKHSRGK